MLEMLLHCYAALSPSSPPRRGPVSAAAWTSEWRRLVSSGVITSTTEAAGGQRLRFGVCIDKASGSLREFCEDATDTAGGTEISGGREQKVGTFDLILRSTRALL